MVLISITIPFQEQTEPNYPQGPNTCLYRPLIFLRELLLGPIPDALRKHVSAMSDKKQKEDNFNTYRYNC